MIQITKERRDNSFRVTGDYSLVIGENSMSTEIIMHRERKRTV
jgi:hypothetical protein